MLVGPEVEGNGSEDGTALFNTWEESKGVSEREGADVAPDFGTRADSATEPISVASDIAPLAPRAPSSSFRSVVITREVRCAYAVLVVPAGRVGCLKLLLERI